jgi:hypothetical protein
VVSYPPKNGESRDKLYRGKAMNIERNYIVDDRNRKIAVQLDIKTFERIENVLENYALVQL